MTFGERVQAVAKQGFTERQARFLTTVMLHAGVCVPRQYARFCGIVHGAKTPKFFAKLVRPQYASMYDYRHNRARRSLESRRPISLTSPSVRVTPGAFATSQIALPIGIHLAGRGVLSRVSAPMNTLEKR
jgi:hypothetical protein